MRVVLLLILMACTADKDLPLDTGDPADSQPPATDDSASDDPVDTAPEAVPPADIFDETVIHEVSLTLGTDAQRALQRDPYEWVEGAATLDGTALASVGVRLRGKLGSFREIDEKPKFKLDFNRYTEGQKFQGLKSLALNNEVVDCSYLKEMTGYAVFRQMGVAASRTSYAHVEVDGEDYGLYVIVEFPDDRFLKRNFEDPSGRLYDGKYLWFGGRDYALADFTTDLEGNFELEQGEDIGGADIFAVTDALLDDGGFSERLAPVVNEDALHTFVTAEQWIGHLDGYSLNINNYRVYFDPADGRATLIPWDLDYAFISPFRWGKSWKTPSGALVVDCWADADCLAAQGESALAIAASFDSDAILTRIDAWTALISEAAQEDPRRECRPNAIETNQEKVRDWIDGREEDIAESWTSE